jgi:tRNA dimethylallyltransferase
MANPAINLVNEFIKKKPVNPLIVVLGPTCTGKTKLAIELAQDFDGEIISADSRAIYQEVDRGTAKPTAEELAAAPHHLISVYPPSSEITLVEYRKLAEQKIAEIRQRGKLPMLAGSHTLLISSIVLNYLFPTEQTINQKLRDSLESEYDLPDGPAKLWSELKAADTVTAQKIPPQNRYHLLRALELTRNNVLPSQAKQKGARQYDTLLLGLTLPRPELYARINARVDAMLEAGLLTEVQALIQKYERLTPALRGHGYRELIDYLAGEKSLTQAITEIKQNTRNYAKRQQTWWRSSPLASEIHWI